MGTNFKFDWAAVKEKLKTEAKKTFEKDARFWTPTTDDKGNSLSILRFLPDKTGIPFVKYYTHSFDFLKDGQKKWWIRNCINTHGFDQKCPICEKNMELWNSAFESDKALASKRKRKINYVSNILIVQDKANPEAEGSVFLYRYGTKIFDKLKKHMFPSDQDREDPDFIEFVPFDLYEGANFKLKTKKQGDYPNYDDSEFSRQSELFNGDDKKIGKVMSETFELAEFMMMDKFPTNQDLLRYLGTVLSLAAPEEAREEKEKKEEKAADPPADPPAKKETKKKAEPEPEDDDEAFFRNLK